MISTRMASGRCSPTRITRSELASSAGAATAATHRFLSPPRRDASGQGRFGTIIRSYSRGAQGILLVYDITNKWSFASLDRWLQEVEEHAPGIPKLLIGNRLHLAFKRQVNVLSAENYAHKHSMSFFEISPLCNYNIKESFAELSRIVLKRHGMSNLWKHNSGK